MGSPLTAELESRVRNSVGQPIPQIDSVEKTKGLTPYIADLSVPGMLHGAIVRSPVPHARIRSIDTSRALRLPGVWAVITGKDTPGIPFGPHKPEDWEILCKDKVRYVGDEVAAVAASSPELAREAAALVKVEYEVLPAVYDPFAAMQPEAPQLWEQAPENIAMRYHIERGDVESALAAADHVIEHDFYTGRYHHAYMEPIGCIAQYYPDGSYTLWTPTHVPFRARMVYAKGLGVSMDRLRIVVPPFGGSFGAKYELNVNTIAFVLARAAGKPVKIMFDREEDFAAGHPRMGLHFQYKLGVNRDGRFVGRITQVVGTGGARTHWTPPVLSTACHRVDSLYHFQNVKADGLLVYTNQSPSTCMRGFGNAEACTALETLIDKAAEKLGADPVEIRKLNAVQAGDTSLHGWRIDSCGYTECLDRAVSLSEFYGRRQPPPPAVPPRGILRGIGIAGGNHISGNRVIINEFDGASAQVRIGFDGQVAVITGEPDIGQGQNTVLAQIAAEVLGENPQRVRVLPVDTMTSPHGVGTLGSRTTTVAGRAVQIAAEAAREQLVTLAASLLAVAPEQIELRAGMAVVTGRPDLVLTFAQLGQAYTTRHAGAYLIGNGFFAPPTEVPDGTKYGNLSASYVFGAHVAEVEVEADTGVVRVVGYTAVHDSGTIINPSTAVGQVHGGVAQGLGSAILEELLLGVDGQVANPNLMDYRVPGFRDVPEMKVDFVQTHDPHGPFGAKSLGESSINPAAAAIVNAIYNATGVRVCQIPITPERLWAAMEVVRVVKGGK